MWPRLPRALAVGGKVATSSSTAMFARTSHESLAVKHCMSALQTHRRWCATALRPSATAPVTNSALNPPPPPPSPLDSAASYKYPFDLDDLIRGNHRALGKAITLVESDNPEHAARVGQLLRDVASRRRASSSAAASASLSSSTTVTGFGGSNPRAATTLQRMKAAVPRIAISGSPGAGKSCFIEAFGMYLVETVGLCVGVIAVDPSSSVTRGSIMGDKTRMDRLSMHPRAFVRPSPSRGHLGGVTARCWEVMSLMEAANFDVILVETVGVGQSEIAAKRMTDIMVLLVPPASGDELQGIKKGIVEVADMIIVTKDDGERKLLAEHARVSYTQATHYRSNMSIHKPVITVSAFENTNIDGAWEALKSVWISKETSGELQATREAQRMQHFEDYFEHELLYRAKQRLRDTQNADFEGLREAVAKGDQSPREAAERALTQLFPVPV